ncbi:AAA family ATPase [Kribbella sp. NPDC050281]|uniref:AAA family ATPase n=1 Tax=Kribbella sp. NPDC050281 TaxID=3155515 RepID=UPI0033C8D338
MTQTQTPTDREAADDLGQWLRARLIADETLTDEQRSLILSAFAGSAELDIALSAVATATITTDAHQEAVQLPSQGIFLKGIAVEGFRGIGPRLHVALHPSPGLTVICGRNGSGKSSIAEALEVALTGTTHRWSGKIGVQWRDAWRNIHHGGQPSIRVQLTEEDTGETTIGLDWSGTGTVEQFTAWFQRHSQAKTEGLTELGWSAPLASFRPMLSYDELGDMFSAGPSKLYDALALVLGLEQISDALKRLAQRLQELSEPAKALQIERLTLQERMESIHDDRSTQAADLLKGAADLDGLAAIAAGDVAWSGSRAQYLEQIASTQLVADEPVTAAAESLTAAVARLAQIASGIGHGVVLREELLKQALALHDHEGDQICPLCGQGQLDEAWVVRARATLADSDTQLAELRSARRAHQASRTEALRLIQPMPEVLARIPESDLPGLVAARNAWTEWLTTPEDDLALAVHLTTNHQQLQATLDELRRQAVVELQSLDEAWAPIAAQLTSWVQRARLVERDRPRVDLLTKAQRWLKENDTRLKNERLRPISDKARHIWAALRQESNVDISGLRLEGSTTRRRVAIDATVDGSESGAISVMSQGELHAMALALFLPRATMPASPFRFVILDDPVQAMDPAKIDGLVTVLSEIAQERQVVVLSHDDRLPEAVRRSSVPARILEVSRSSNSAIAINNVRDPATRYLSDAYALIKDDRLPDTTLRRALPGILRLAAESAARDRYFSTEFSAGTAAITVEKTWASALTTRRRVALAVLGSADGNLGQWLSQHARRRRALDICGAAAHNGLSSDPRDAYEDVKKLVGDMRASDT